MELNRVRERGGFKKYFARAGVLFPQAEQAVPSGGQLTHQPQGQMSVRGLCTSVPGTARVWSAVGDTPQSTQAVSCGLRQRPKQRPWPRVEFFFPGRVRHQRLVDKE